MIAAADYQEETVTLLLEAGADINKKDPQGKTALYYASRATMNDRVIEMLKKAGGK